MLQTLQRNQSFCRFDHVPAFPFILDGLDKPHLHDYLLSLRKMRVLSISRLRQRWKNKSSAECYLKASRTFEGGE